jgi:hypothetical protein
MALTHGTADALVDRYLKKAGPLAQPHILALTNQG